VQSTGLVGDRNADEFELRDHAFLRRFDGHHMPSSSCGVTAPAIAFTAMRTTLGSYLLDTLMPDLVGHDRRPAAFIVYLYLARLASLSGRDSVLVSLQTIATHTGLCKSRVQASLRHLRRRRLLDPSVAATVTKPVRKILRPWLHAR
jgi:hypothetical protein